MNEGHTERLEAALDGRYRIERQLGEGGMATVYLAKDLRHNRSVALKVLKPELAAVVGGERFLAEIETTANLQHPHILPLHDSGEADGLLFYVMPHVEGESLRERLDREHQLPVEEAVRIATNVAEALDYAHRHGVIHRDIKPANILLQDGKPVVSDFGIALAVSGGGAGRLTETGLSLGTPHYMSPEQATGDQSVGPATDIWALGCVLYEMLVGEPPFAASTVPAVLAKILTVDAPPVIAVRKTVPLHVEGAILQALEKLPADRFQSAGEFSRALGDDRFRYAGRPAAGADERPEWIHQRLPTRSWLRDSRSVALLGAALLVGAWAALRGATSEVHSSVVLRAPLTEVVVGIGAVASESHVAMSRDGRQIAVWGRIGAVRGIHVRAAAEREWRAIPGTEDARSIDFSPDGRSLVFDVQGGEIRRVQITGGPVLPVTRGSNPHWGLEGVMVFHRGSGVYRIEPGGGSAVLITAADGAAGGRPHLLPDARGVLFHRTQADGQRWLMLVDLESGEVTDLGVAGSHVRYVPTGHLVFGHPSQSIQAVPFDLATQRVTGEAVTVLTDVLVYASGAAQFAVSEVGTVVYARGGDAAPGGEFQLVTVDVDGRESPTPLRQRTFSWPRFSPDGSSLTYFADGRIWVWSRDTGATTPLTAGAATDRYPLWSHDGRWIYYSSDHTGGMAAFRSRADGSSEPELLFGPTNGRRITAEPHVLARRTRPPWSSPDLCVKRGAELLGTSAKLPGPPPVSQGGTGPGSAGPPRSW